MSSLFWALVLHDLQYTYWIKTETLHRYEKTKRHTVSPHGCVCVHVSTTLTHPQFHCVLCVFMITNPWWPELKVIVSFLGVLYIASFVFSLTTKALCYRVVGSEHQEAQQMLFLSLSHFTLPFIHMCAHPHSHTITIHYFITAFIMILTKLASATGNKLLNHTAVFSTS